MRPHGQALDFQCQRPILLFGVPFSNTMLVLLPALGLIQSVGVYVC